MKAGKTRIRDGALSALRTPTNPPVPTMLVPLDASPLNILRSMRGAIVDARIVYPEVLHVKIKDSDGELWRLATQDAEWSPSDPAQLGVDYAGRRRLGVRAGGPLADR